MTHLPSFMRRVSAALLVCALACGGTEAWPDKEPIRVSDSSDLVTITVIGSNDIHGAVERFPAFAGYVEVLRAARREQGGGLLLVDGGDIFQGTLESNLGEGEAMIELMNALGYDAAAIGNHEFDFGPVGARATPKDPGDDPRGALKARAAQAKFPLLGANVVDSKTGKLIDWPNTGATRTVTVAGVKVGIIGLSTVETPQTTLAANVVGLTFAPLAETVIREARALRKAGVGVVVVTAHAGGICKDFSSPYKVASCRDKQEIFELAQALPTGLVDLIVAGHTHRGVAHIVNGIPIIEQYAHSRYFGRVDLAVSAKTGKVVQNRILPPHPVCRDGNADTCKPFEAYEGRPVVIPKEIAAIARKWQEKARVARDEVLGAVAETEITRSRHEESLMGNWVADLMLAVRPADVAITNGGGLRSNIEPGPITYGELYRVLPFDNRFAIATVTGAQLKSIFAANLGHDGGILSIAGATVKAECKGGKLSVAITRKNGKAISDDEKILVTTSDFLATTGREFVGGGGEVRVEDDPTIRDAIAALLRKRKTTIGARDLTVFDPRRPRVSFPGERPIECQ